MSNLKIIIEKHSDGYVAYPLGITGAVVAQGDSYDEAMANVKSAIEFHVETFGRDVLEGKDDILEAFVTEATVKA
jgi:predicted RNase H-like HicB family nuclease